MSFVFYVVAAVLLIGGSALLARSLWFGAEVFIRIGERQKGRTARLRGSSTT
jgi:hypothetical protein